MTTPTVVLHPVIEAIEKLGGIGRTTLYEMIRNGQIGTVHIGNRVFIPSDEIAAFIDRNRRFGSESRMKNPEAANPGAEDDDVLGHHLVEVPEPEARADQASEVYRTSPVKNEPGDDAA